MTNNSESELGMDAEAIARARKTPRVHFRNGKRKLTAMYLNMVVNNL
jgi:hypothetical protein